MDPNFQVYWHPDDGISSVSELSTSLDELVNVISAKSHHSVVIIENDPEKLKWITRILMRVAKPGSFLKEIHFRSIFEINDVGCKNISMELTDSSVIRLGLGSTKVGREGIGYICDHLQQYANITQLDLEYLSEEGVACMLSNIKKLNISWLSFNGAIISKHLYYDLFQMLKNNQTIKTFGFPESSDDYDVQIKLHYWLEDCFQENFTLDSLVEFTHNSLVEFIHSSYSLANFIQLHIKWFLKRNKICKEMKASKPQGSTIPYYIDIKDISKFLADIQKNSEELRVMKLMVLGDGKIGKTTLLNTMKSILREKHQKLSNIVNTVGIDCDSLQLARGELSVWDFGKIATHSMFLSVEIPVVLICFNLQASKNKQMKQISFWLDFLNSNFSLPPFFTDKISKWIIIIVGVCADKQCDFTLTTNSTIVSELWKKKWPQFPIASTIFSVSSLTSIQSVQHLLQFIETEVNNIFDVHVMQIPSTYHQFLFKLKTLAQNNFVFHWEQLHIKFKNDTKYDEIAFKAMLQYCHLIGKIIWLPTNYIFIDPTLISKITAKFMFSKTKLKLLEKQNEKVEILNKTEVESLLKIDITDNKRLSQELELITHLKICFPFKTADSNELLYLFPSLSSNTENKLQFQKHLCVSQTMAGIRFIAFNGTFFVQGFFCQLLVSLFQALNIHRENIMLIVENGAIIQCPNLFFGEMLIILDFYQQSIIVAMSASDFAIEYAISVFNTLVANEFPQYTGSKQEILCETCLYLCFIDAQLPVKNIGTFKENQIICSTQQHQKNFYQKELCNAHNKSEHHIFINYNSKTEGNRSQFSSVEPSGGAIEYLFSLLTMQKTKVERPIFVFWSKKCLQEGFYEYKYIHTLRNSQIVLLLMSNEAHAILAERAQKYYNFMLFVYEVALLLYKIFKVPVFYIFLADLKENKSTSFQFNNQFPDVPHKRNNRAQYFIDHLSYFLPDSEREFLKSIKQTMNEIFKLQGVFMKERFESTEEVNNLIQRILSVLMKAPFVPFRFASGLSNTFNPLKEVHNEISIHSSSISDFTFLKEVQNEINIHSSSISDLTFLNEVQNEINICSSSISDLTFLKEVQNEINICSSSISDSTFLIKTINLDLQKPPLLCEKKRDVLITSPILTVGVATAVVVGVIVWAIYFNKS